MSYGKYLTAFRCPPGAGPQSASRPCYTPAGGFGAGDRQAPGHIVGFGDTRIRAETATFEVRASEIASPRAGNQLTIGGETFIVQGEPERPEPDRLVWALDVRQG
jgi:hypothetical protein